MSALHWLSTGFFFGGIALTSAGVMVWSLPWGLITAGAWCLVMSWACHAADKDVKAAQKGESA